MDSRYAPSYPAHSAGDALGERASAAKRRARRQHSGMMDVPHSQAVGDRLGEANVLLALGDLERGQSRYDPAWNYYIQVKALYEAIGDRYSLARVLYRMGDWQMAQSNQQAAIQLYDQAIRLWRSIGANDLVEQILIPRRKRAEQADV